MPQPSGSRDAIPLSGGLLRSALPWFSSINSRRVALAKAAGESATSQTGTDSEARPSAPTLVETTGMPDANASSNFTLIPEPLNIGQTNTEYRCSGTLMSGTDPAAERSDANSIPQEHPNQPGKAGFADAL